MKKFYITLLTFIIAALQVFAAPVDPEKALEIANDFWRSNISTRKKTQSRLVPASEAMKSPSRFISSKEHASYYIFTDTCNNGIVIVSGDDRLNPIAGYSTNAVPGEMPPALTAWLNDYSNYVDDVREGKAKPSLNNAKEALPRIEPMLVTAWDQDEPYNNMCPLIDGKKTFTGCGNTAAAQVMRFHKWPANPIADVEWYNNITGETEFCKLTSHVYDWENMIYNYSSDYSETEADAVALLMADLGKATESTYSAETTGNSSPSIAYALVHVFNYSPELFISERSDYTYDEYIALIRENLNNRQPIIYCGFGQNFDSGHGFVCDGIDENNLLHIDWGWSGSFNGYFDMAAMEPEGNGIGGLCGRYNVAQNAIMNIKPRAEGEVNKGGNITLDGTGLYDLDAEKIVDELSCEFVDGIAEVGVLLKYVNYSHSEVEGAIGLGVMDEDGNLAREIEFGDIDIIPRSLEQKYDDSFIFSVSNVNSSEYYLPVGKYAVGLFFMDTEEEIEYIRSAYNGVILEVTENGITLSFPKPSYELDEFSIIKMPEHSDEDFVFNATFANNNINKLVVLVPVINHYENGVKVKSEVKTDAAVTTILLDTNNILVTFTIPDAFAQSGTYTISFEYLFKHEETDIIDTSKLKSIAGESAPIEAEIIPEDVDVYDYSFAVELVGQESVEEADIAILRTTMGADISEYKFLISNSINEDSLEAVAESIVSGECENCYTMNKSSEFRMYLDAGEYAIVVVLYDVNGEPLDEYYTYTFTLTTGIDNVKGENSEIYFDRNNNVISVAKEGVIELLDVNGRVVKRVYGNNISVVDIEAGIYIVKYNNNVAKIVKR